MTFAADELDAARALIDVCRRRGLKIATAESCTGGLVAAVLTAVAGASNIFERGFATYSNEAKQEELGVPASLFAEGGPGAVSEEVARAMAEGALRHSHADVACGITGVAGPTGGSAEKPVGLVHIAAARAGRTLHERNVFDGDREEVRWKSTERALAMMAELAKDVAEA